MMTLYEKRSKNVTLLVPYIPLAPKIPIESGSNSNLEPPPPVRTSDRYGDRSYRKNVKRQIKHARLNAPNPKKC